jgi:hypothetical protein
MTGVVQEPATAPGKAKGHPIGCPFESFETRLIRRFDACLASEEMI